jgi:hypothetical protein
MWSARAERGVKIPRHRGGQGNEETRGGILEEGLVFLKFLVQFFWTSVIG